MNDAKSFSITDEDCERLAFKIKSEVYEPVVTYKRSVFLCGADIRQKDKIRFKIAESLVRKWHANLFDLIYPEEIFDELLYGSHSKDLLSLENLLADSVDAVVVIPESPGSFTELGAFVNSEKLRKRVVCVIDKKYSRDKSFINRGPIKLIKEEFPDRVIVLDTEQMEKGVSRLRKVILEMERASPSASDKISLLQIENFLLPAIYLLEPVSRDIIAKLVGFATKDRRNSYHVTITALSSLSKKKQIELTGIGYKLTKLGVESYIRLRRQRSRSDIRTRTFKLDDLRLEVLNYSNRGKRLKV